MRALCAGCGGHLTVDEVTHYGATCESCEAGIFYVDEPQAWFTSAKTIEALGAIFGLAGTILLALKVDIAGWGFVAFLASNCAWLAFSWMRRHWFMFAQQVGFTITSLLGIYNWLVLPAMGAAS